MAAESESDLNYLQRLVIFQNNLANHIDTQATTIEEYLTREKMARRKTRGPAIAIGTKVLFPGGNIRESGHTWEVIDWSAEHDGYEIRDLTTNRTRSWIGAGGLWLAGGGQISLLAEIQPTEEVRFLTDTAQYQRSVSKILRDQSASIQQYIHEREALLRALAGPSFKIGSYVNIITAAERDPLHPTKYRVLSYDPSKDRYELYRMDLRQNAGYWGALQLTPTSPPPRR
jgi:hypothetical protein